MNDKPKFNPNIHHRRSIRLKGYDYSQAGAYFITICVKDKTCLFGDIVNDEMVLNDAGRMINKWWEKVPEKFIDIELDEYQVMPNHFHAIVVNTGNGNAGADGKMELSNDDVYGEHKGSPLYDIVRWFKTMCTNEYIRNVNNNNWPPFNGKLLQRNYWEHIIRDAEAYYKIASYIRNNPVNWKEDKFYNE